MSADAILLDGDDQRVLLQMADAWELRAQEADRQLENGKKSFSDLSKQ